RYQYLIYSRDYGHDFDDLVGKGNDLAVQQSEIQRIVVETLMVDPRTASVGTFSFSWQDDTCYFSCKITSIRDVEKLLEGSVGT
ncbi:MAG: DUF2634 domain-containing protein, partial [Gorillibacterium sp.]|nr:DUF2634 domain-containing protein [Gorillibacterium sp.]